MKQIVATAPQKYRCSPQEAFVIGILHDIGYEFSDIQKEHCFRGGELLKEQEYKYWQEIYYHGVTQQQYASQELDLLNYADMTTGPKGENMTLNERIDDIIIRYGNDSAQAKDAQKIIEKLVKAGFQKMAIENKDNKITNYDVLCFFADKKEHYSISDKFIFNYQQKSTDNNSYIRFALDTGHIICEKIAEPNQKWHLMEAYLLQNLLIHGAEYLDKKNTLGRIKCPELLLWMAEAANVSKEVVEMASNVAKEKIDEIRKETNKAYSAKAVIAMNDKIESKYNGKTIWVFIEEKIAEWKN